MDYIRSYKSFISSHYLNEGIRMTVGILFPALLMNQFDLLDIGIVCSLGALFVSVTDNPGPIHHRKNGMLACNASVFMVSLISGLIVGSPVLLGLFLLTSCFIFSMLGVFGSRAASIGIVSLMALVLDIGHQRQGWEVVEHSLYVTSGGLWYMFFSMLLYNFRPYKLIQQALGEWIQTIADYLEIRAELYDKDVNYDSTYKRLLQQQALVQDKQAVVNDLIFKTRSIVKESTHTGRILVMTYLDAADMFERIMTSYQRYSLLHEYFDETGILGKYRKIALTIATELHEVGIAIKSGEPSHSNPDLQQYIQEAKERREELRATYLNSDNIDGFITLKRILENVQDLADRLQTLHKYTTYDESLKKRKRHDVDYEQFISHERITPKLLLDNLTLKSDIFRHSLRICIAVMTGYIVSLFFTIGHSYWILLTIIVILKPEYSLTKERNKDRLLGTVLGVAIGILVLKFIDNNQVLFLIMVLLMAASFIYMRQNYFLNVLLMTPYVILFFYLVKPESFRGLLMDRVIDTIIGSVIAFSAIVFLMPFWERQKIKPLMVRMLEEGVHYFTVIGEAFAEQKAVPVSRQQLARQDALVALANLSAAFNRMLSEPKNQQVGIKDIHQFVVLNHMLTSYIATLSAYLKMETIPYSSEELVKVIEDIKQYFLNAIKILESQEVTIEVVTHKDSLHKLNDEANALLEKRRSELQQGELETTTKKTLFNVKSVVDQFNLIYKVAVDINKVSSNIVETNSV